MERRPPPLCPDTAHVRLRLRLARMLGHRALRDVSAPRRSWRRVQRDRQIAFTALEFGVRQAARDHRLSRSQVRRAIRRVRGLAGRCWPLLALP
jgi:hypothetical protein